MITTWKEEYWKTFVGNSQRCDKGFFLIKEKTTKKIFNFNKLKNFSCFLFYKKKSLNASDFWLCSAKGSKRFEVEVVFRLMGHNPAQISSEQLGWHETIDGDTKILRLKSALIRSIWVPHGGCQTGGCHTGDVNDSTHAA